jgi:hypothetical protein
MTDIHRRTKEPATALPGWPESHARASLTDDNTHECVEVVIHKVAHLLHASTARALHNDLSRVLEEFNAQARAAGMPEV